MSIYTEIMWRGYMIFQGMIQFYFPEYHQKKHFHMWKSNLSTVNFLNIRTPKKFVEITLKVERCGSTIE